MPSGYNLQGIIRRNTVNALTQFERMGFYSENISNWSTNAYKASRFEEILGENGYANGVVRTDHSQGSIQVTKENLILRLMAPVYSNNITYRRNLLYKRWRILPWKRRHFNDTRGRHCRLRH